MQKSDVVNFLMQKAKVQHNVRLIEIAGFTALGAVEKVFMKGIQINGLKV